MFKLFQIVSISFMILSFDPSARSWLLQVGKTEMNAMQSIMIFDTLPPHGCGDLHCDNANSRNAWFRSPGMPQAPSVDRFIARTPYHAEGEAI
jgi:hypothetical protein